MSEQRSKKRQALRTCPFSAGEKPPPQPQRQKAVGYIPFDGALVDRYITDAGCDYVRIVFGAAGGAATEVDEPSSVIDAEFLFLPSKAGLG
jgi:hypothetical protein